MPTYLFERFFYYLEDLGPAAYGIVVFDELDKVQSHLLLAQMDRYFNFTTRGRHRSGQILPEPLFVHSDLTTGVQLADLISYIVSWGVRFQGNGSAGERGIGDARRSRATVAAPQHKRRCAPWPMRWCPMA